jgi:hypothetical protein
MLDVAKKEVIYLEVPSDLKDDLRRIKEIEKNQSLVR